MVGGKENISNVSENLFWKNEVRANKVTSIALLLLGIFFVAMFVLDKFALFDLLNNTIRYFILGFGCADILAFVVAKKVNYERKQLKSMTLCMILLSSGVTFFFHPLLASFITYGPIIVASLYFNLKFVRKIAFFSILLYSFLLWANVVLENASEIIRLMHSVQEITMWQYPTFVMQYYYFPKIVVFLITSVVCDGVVRRGIYLVKRQAEVTAEVSFIESDLKTASEIQLEALPDKSYTTPVGNIHLDAFIRPAKVVGGDFYDYFICGKNIVFLIADVSDKGMPAAMFMMKAKYTVRTAILNGHSFEKSIAIANDELCNNNLENMFVTLWIASVNMKTGAGKYINCGHLNPIIRHTDGSIETIEKTPNLVLGIFKDSAFQSHYIQLQKDDTLFLFTDGLTDAENSENVQLGMDNLCQILQNIPSDDDDVCTHVISKIDAFATNSNQFDDMTLMVVSPKDSFISETKNYEFDAKYESIESLLCELNPFLEAHFCPEDVRRDIDTAIDEVCGNIVDYAYDDENGKFRASVTIGDNFIDMTISDNGKQFNPLAVQESNQSEDLQVGGLGIFLVKNLMEHVEYSYANNQNNLRMCKMW